MGLLQLPPEILINIFRYLDVPDTCATQSANHFLNSIYKASLELQYTHECEIAHVRDNPNCHLPIEDRLRMLREREAAWMSLEPTSKKTISPASDFCRYSRVPPVVQRDNYVLFDSSSSTIKSRPIQELHEDTFRSFKAHDVKFICCCIEEHDLIVYLACPHISSDRMEVQVNLIEHSTGKAHPLATNPTIVVCTTPIDTGFAMEVFGENLVLTTESDDEYAMLYVYNWMTGEAKSVSLLRLYLTCRILPRSELTDKEPTNVVYKTGIVVLDGDLILIPQYHPTWSLRIYYIPPSSTGGTFKMICQLGLPVLLHIAPRLLRIRCQSAPNPTGNGKFPKYVPSSVPFIDEPKTALIHIIWGFWSNFTADYDYDTISLVVHRSSIMNTLPPSNHWSAITTPKRIDWESWGPPVTSWTHLPWNQYESSRNNIHGQRIIFPIHPRNSNNERGNPPGAALLKDYNKYHARRVQGEKDYSNFNHFWLFRPVKGTLPFCESYLPIQNKCQNSSDYSITDGLIIGLHATKMPGGGSKTHSLEVMHFGC